MSFIHLDLVCESVNVCVVCMCVCMCVWVCVCVCALYSSVLLEHGSSWLQLDVNTIATQSNTNFMEASLVIGSNDFTVRHAR